MTRFLTPHIVWGIIFFLYIGIFSAHAFYLDKTIFGDGVYYYSWLRSTIVDHDINFTNDYALLGGHQPPLRGGNPGNKYSIGPALLWAPVFLPTYSIFRGDGTAFPYHYIVGLSSVLYALVGLLLLYRILDRSFSQNISLLTILAVALCTNLLFYGSVDPVNSHGLTFFAACLFLTFLFEKKLAFAAVALALLGSIRLQDMLLGILFIPLLTRKNMTSIAVFTSLGFIPQLLAWYFLFGSLANPYISGGEGFSLLSPHLIEVLFAPWYGFITVTPIVLLGIIGLSFHLRGGKLSRWQTYALIAIALEIYTVSSWGTWWQGASYGSRMLISTLPILCLGIASVLAKLPKRFMDYFPLSVVIPLFLINCLQIIWFLLKT